MGIFHANESPLFASINADEWVGFLHKVWNNPQQIKEIKEKNCSYMLNMDKFITEQYKKFLSDKSPIA